MIEDVMQVCANGSGIGRRRVVREVAREHRA